MDATVHGVVKSRTRLSDFHFHYERPGFCLAQGTVVAVSTCVEAAEE